MIRTLVLLAAIAGVIAPADAAQTKKKPKAPEPPPVRIELVAGFSMTYDDNVFRYSSDEIDAIKNLPQTDQYSTVETTDDLILAQSLAVAAYRGDTRITLSVKQNSNYRNTMKSYHNYSVDLRQRVGPAFYAYLTYRFTPRYYIRQIYDLDTMDYEEYDYAKHYVAAEARKGFLNNRLSVRGHGRYEREKYPDYFQEYDFHGFAVEGEAKYAFTRRLTLGLIGSYRRISTKGYDEPWETKETSDETDGSYHENTFELFGSYALPMSLFGSTPSVSLGGSFNKKAYTTDRGSLDDPYHAGREDTKVAVEAGWSTSVGQGISANLSYKWQERRVDSYAQDDLGEEKDFTANTVGLSISVTKPLLGGK